MTIPRLLKEQSIFKVPLTFAHYGLIGLRRRRLARRYPVHAQPGSDIARDALVKLQRDGWALLEGYISPQECAAIRADIDRIIEDRPGNLQSEYNGAEHRYFGSEALSASINRFHSDPLLSQIASSYVETQIVNIATLAGKSLPAESETKQTGRWHRDSFGRQIKALAYLSDVTEQSGPFEFIDGSHRLSRIANDLRAGGLKLLQWRLEDEDVDRVRQRTGIESRKVLASEGTVILIDTSCIHRAMPVSSGVRYAITNYYIERGRYRQEIADSLKVPFRAAELSPQKA